MFKRDLNRKLQSSANTDSAPMEWDDAGRVLDDTRAAKAIEGMPVCEISQALEAYELQYQECKTGSQTGWDGAILRFVAWFIGAKPVNYTSGAVKILRAMIADLANAHSKLVTDYKANEINAEVTGQIHQIHGDQVKLRAFLYRHFNEELAVAESLNQPLLDLCMKIMLKEKQ